MRRQFSRLLTLERAVGPHDDAKSTDAACSRIMARLDGIRSRLTRGDTELPPVAECSIAENVALGRLDLGEALSLLRSRPGGVA